jgi:glycosyltransferase involved in cell wall biosynthesis
MIRALPEVITRHLDLLYLVLGETHPEVRRQAGEQYRHALIDLVKTLRLEQHVRFVNQDLTMPQLLRYLQATDVSVTPASERNQITSGTLAYALGCGKAVVSTPYLYAAEAPAEGRGVLAAFQDPQSFAHCGNLFLEQRALLAQGARGAFAYGPQMRWEAVSARYADLFHAVAGTAPAAASVAGTRDLLRVV